MDIGSLRHFVRLENPTETADADGGFTTTWALLTPGVVSASIEPATAGRMERLMAGSTVTANVTHLVILRYHSGVTMKTRVVFANRILQVVGKQNPFERNEMLYLACVEQVQ